VDILGLAGFDVLPQIGLHLHSTPVGPLDFDPGALIDRPENVANKEVFGRLCSQVVEIIINLSKVLFLEFHQLTKGIRASGILGEGVHDGMKFCPALFPATILGWLHRCVVHIVF
jgi:hypothetical protein